MSTTNAERVHVLMQMIPLEQLRESPFNPRKRYDPNRLMEMAASIKQQGIIEPLVVRVIHPHERDGVFEIVAGSRRFRAAKLAQQTTVPCLVRALSDDDAITAGHAILLARLTPPDQKMGLDECVREPAKDYTKAGAKKCPDTKVALVAGGAGLGTDFKICTNPKCRVHHPGTPVHETTPTEKRERRRAQVDKLAEERILVATLKSVAGRPITIPDQQLMALGVLGELFGDGGEELCEIHRLPYKKGKWNSAFEALEKEISRCTNRARLVQWALELAIASRSRADLLVVAKRRHVDVAKIRREVAAELDAAKAKPKAQTSAKPKPKK